MQVGNRISAIILNWNRYKATINAIKSIKDQTYRPFEIIIVDQHSSDNGPENIKKFFPDVNIIKLECNRGVPTGRNIGARYAKGDILVFIDNDVTLDEKAFEMVIEEFSAIDKLSIIGFKIIDANTGELDLSSWVYEKKRINEADKRFETYTYCGAGHAIRKEVFEKLGGYWEKLFFSWEEIEFSLRVLDKGYTILYQPNIIAFHKKTAENRILDIQHECMRLRNSLWVVWRYYPFMPAIINTFIRISAYFVKGIRKRCFLKMFLTAISALKESVPLFLSPYKISKKTITRIKNLRQSGSITEQLFYLFFK